LWQMAIRFSERFKVTMTDTTEVKSQIIMFFNLDAYLLLIT